MGSCPLISIFLSLLFSYTYICVFHVPINEIEPYFTSFKHSLVCCFILKKIFFDSAHFNHFCYSLIKSDFSFFKKQSWLTKRNLHLFTSSPGPLSCSLCKCVIRPWCQSPLQMSSLQLPWHLDFITFWVFGLMSEIN